MAGYWHLVCLFVFGSWHVCLHVEITPTSTDYHGVTPCISLSLLLTFYSVLILVNLVAIFVTVSSNYLVMV
jgi:hypothetical protein